MRAFVAVDVPALPLGGGGAPAAPAHLTLLFFSELPEARVAAFADAARRIAAAHPSFELGLAGVGAFPSPERPRVVWVGIDRGAETLSAIHGELREAATALGLTVDDRPFVPHLTLFRVRGGRDADRAAELLRRHATTVFDSFPVGELVLKSSQLTDRGAVHQVVDRFPLGVPATPG